jgi:GrpB-like predicted nucleotidyltransferase (UPF0157 family)
MTYHLSKPISVEPYDPQWPTQFEQEKRRVLTVLGPLLLRIEHFGSTSVPGLAAKPIIDMLGAVRHLEDVSAFVEPLRGLGYEDAAIQLGYWTVPDRRLFCVGSYNEGSHHLHLVELNSTPWVGNLRVRDFLRTHPEVAEQYARLKENLAVAHGTDIDSYTEGKTALLLAAAKSQS